MLGVAKNFVHRSSTLPTIFHRNFRFEIKITVSHCEIFLVLSCKNIQKFLWKIISAGKKPTKAKGLQGRFDISFVRLVSESFDVHLSLICKKRAKHKANGATQGEFIDDVSKYRKIVGALFKGKWYELYQDVAQLLERCK